MFDTAGAGNVIMAAGLRATAKAVEHPSEPKVGALVLDPTTEVGPYDRIALWIAIIRLIGFVEVEALIC